MRPRKRQRTPPTRPSTLPRMQATPLAKVATDAKTATKNIATNIHNGDKGTTQA